METFLKQRGDGAADDIEEFARPCVAKHCPASLIRRLARGDEVVDLVAYL